MISDVGRVPLAPGPFQRGDSIAPSVERLEGKNLTTGLTLV